jgi:aminoglycoside phosphotransferase (APT) family kinase protein
VTDFVAFVECETPDGPREAVLEPEVARAEPGLYELVGRETSIPVPAVYGFVDEHPDYPTPCCLLERVAGESDESTAGSLPADVRERVCRDAGANLIVLH